MMEFEVARKSLLDMFHSISSDGSSNSRHLTYEVDKDKLGLIVTEVLKIKNWNILKKSTPFIGECKITIHIDRTTSKFLINGKNAEQLVGLLVPILEDRIATVTMKEEINGCNQELQLTLKLVLEKVKSDVKAEQDPSTAWLLSETSVDSVEVITTEKKLKQEP